MVKVQTTISPRRKRSALLASARSDALEDARGYSPAGQISISTMQEAPASSVDQSRSQGTAHVMHASVVRDLVQC